MIVQPSYGNADIHPNYTKQNDLDGYLDHDLDWRKFSHVNTQYGLRSNNDWTMSTIVMLFVILENECPVCIFWIAIQIINRYFDCNPDNFAPRKWGNRVRKMRVDHSDGLFDQYWSMSWYTGETSSHIQVVTNLYENWSFEMVEGWYIDLARVIL